MSCFVLLSLGLIWLGLVLNLGPFPLNLASLLMKFVVIFLVTLDGPHTSKKAAKPSSSPSGDGRGRREGEQGTQQALNTQWALAFLNRPSGLRRVSFLVCAGNAAFPKNINK